MKQIRKTKNSVFGCSSVLAAALFLGTSLVASAEDAVNGDLNPSEYTYEGVLEKIKHRQISDIECIYGYEFAKHGRHAEARLILNYCAGERGLTQAMTMLSWMDENGYAIDRPDYEAAARWDRRAADLGDPNAQLNYGLSLLRGHGVELNNEEGREYIRRAAANGDKVAKQLVANGYNLAGVAGLNRNQAHAAGERMGMAKAN